MITNPICEPFTNFPARFDIEEIAAEFKPKDKEKDVEKTLSPRDFLNIPDKNWVILPMFKYHLDHLKPILSVRQNKYMRNRYIKFLDNVPEHFVTVSLFNSNINRYLFLTFSINEKTTHLYVFQSAKAKTKIS